MKIHLPVIIMISIACCCSAADHWPRHTIDDSSKGADGVRLADINSDGLMDITTGWEEGGITRVYINPGPEKAKVPWPAVTVAQTPSVEDAMFTDLDGDSAIDVVACTEGKDRAVYASFAPKDKSRLLDSTAWTQKTIGDSKNKMQFMFAIPMNIDDKNHIDLVTGAKGPGAKAGFYLSPPDPTNTADYKWHPISDAGWIMSLIPCDMDSDGDLDIVTTDRKGPLRGARWLENPGRTAALKSPWKNHWIGALDYEVMFMRLADLDEDGLTDAIVTARKNSKAYILFLKRLDKSGDSWKLHTIESPPNTGFAKAPAIADMNKDGKPDIVVSAERAEGNKRGVILLSYKNSPTESNWNCIDISGPDGIKFDRMELLDLDEDGDLDIIACEESAPSPQGKRKGLGLFWYENPID